MKSTRGLYFFYLLLPGRNYNCLCGKIKKALCLLIWPFSMNERKARKGQRNKTKRESQSKRTKACFRFTTLPLRSFTWGFLPYHRTLLTPGLDNTRLFMSLTAGAGTRCMSLLSSSPSLIAFVFWLRLN